MQLETMALVGTAVSGAATIVLVVFGIFQYVALRRQVTLTHESVIAAQQAVDAANRSVEAARDAVDVALLSVRETARARIDQQASRVITVMENPQWPPRITRASNWQPQILRVQRLLTIPSSGIAGEQEYAFPQDNDYLMWLVVQGIVVNQGATTARITLGGEARFIEGDTPLLPGVHLYTPPIVGEYHTSDHEYLNLCHMLRPHETALFEWGIGFRLHEWIARDDIDATRSLEIVARDPSGGGIKDRTKIDASARPLVEVPGRTGVWKLAKEAATGVTIWPTEREYLSESTNP